MVCAYFDTLIINFWHIYLEKTHLILIFISALFEGVPILGAVRSFYGSFSVKLTKVYIYICLLYSPKTQVCHIALNLGMFGRNKACNKRGNELNAWVSLEWIEFLVDTHAIIGFAYHGYDLARHIKWRNINIDRSVGSQTGAVYNPKRPSIKMKSEYGPEFFARASLKRLIVSPLQHSTRETKIFGLLKSA